MRHRSCRHWHVSAEQREALHTFCKEVSASPDETQLDELARRLRMSATRAKLWFQARGRAEAPGGDWFKNRRPNSPLRSRLAAVLVCVYTDTNPGMSLCEATSEAWEVLHEHSRRRAQRIVDEAVYSHVQAHSMLLLASHPSLTSGDTHSLAVRALSERSEALAKWV